MKVFELEIVQRVRISFDSDAATPVSARYVAEHCLARRVPDFGTSRSLGEWRTELLEARVKEGG